MTGKVAEAAWRTRVSLPMEMADAHRRELGAFVRYCVNRIERELGGRDRWSVTLVGGGPLGYASVIRVHTRGTSLEARGLGTDAVLTIWDAMSRVEQRIREQPKLVRTRSLCA